MKTNKPNKTQRKKEAFLKAMEKNLCHISNSCEQTNVGRTTYYEWLEKDPKFKQNILNMQERIIDIAESSLHKQIVKGNTIATIFFLKTKGKDRGYQENILQEVDVKNPISIEFTNINSYPEIGGEKSAKENKGKNIQDKK